MDVGVLLTDRAEGSLSAGIAQGIDVCGRYVVIVGGLPIAEPDWVVPTRHVVPDWAGLDHGALSSGRLWFQSAGRPPGQATAGCHPPARAAARTGWGGGATPVSGFVAFCLGQVPAPAGFPGIHPGIAIKREVHPGAVGDPSPVAAGPELSVPLVKGVARWSVPDARPRGQLPGALPPVLLPPAGWARLLPRKSTGVGNSCPSSLMTVLPISTGALLPSASSDWAERSTGTPSLRSSSLGTAVKVEPVSTVTSRSSNICPCGSPTAMVTFTVPTAFLLSLSLLVACCQDGLVGVPRRLQFCGSCGVCPFPGSPVSLRVHGGSRLRPIFAQDGFYFVFVNWSN